jgi:hypothetical protein
LAPTLGNDARETGQGRDIGEFVERQEKTGNFTMLAIRGVDNFVNEPDYQRGGHGLVTAG